MKQISSNVKLGRHYRDLATDFTGSATGVHITTAGERVCLETLADGKVVEQWFDVSRVVAL